MKLFSVAPQPFLFFKWGIFLGVITAAFIIFSPAFILGGGEDPAPIPTCTLTSAAEACGVCGVTACVINMCTGDMVCFPCDDPCAGLPEPGPEPGPGPGPGPVCGDGSCDTGAGESCSSCSADCGACTYTLNVTSPAGGNRVTGPNIDCPGDCSESFTAGSTVTIGAVPSAGYNFSSWSGACSGAANPTAVTVDADKTCTANFTLQNFTLTITKSGSGGCDGVVTSSPSGITCGGDCSEPYPFGTPVNLTITPNAGCNFTGWSGDPDCSDGSITVNGNKTCNADFSVANSPPNPPGDISVNPGNYCSAPLRPVFSWTFSDPNAGDTQAAYEVEVDNDAGFTSPEVDTGKICSSSNSFSPVAGIAYNTTYSWRVRVWDNGSDGVCNADDAVSPWSSGTFTTPPHAYPDVDFSWSPANPAASEVVQFSDLSACASGFPCSSFIWNFGDGVATTAQNPKHVYSASGTYDVSLGVTDSDGHACTAPDDEVKQIQIGPALPRWKEVPPFSWIVNFVVALTNGFFR